MAQEPGLFSVRRPRETLGGISNNASAIPLPASAMKRSNSISNFQQAPQTAGHARSMSGSRMSLAPGRPQQPMFHRSSSGDNLAGMATAQRTSSSNLFNTVGRKSHANVLATPASSLQLQQSTQRRSSVFSARHSSSAAQFQRQSFFTNAPVPAGVPKDPRPLRDKGYQKQIGQELADYLTQNNFEMEAKYSLSPNFVVSPTQKDFNKMFEWLYKRIDPSYNWYKSIDQEVPPILKQLRYPYEKSITKSQIGAVGGANWAQFLGILHWMMQLARMMEQYAYGNYDEACAEAGHDVSGDRIIFDFLTDAYHEWLAMEDDQEDQADQLMKPHIARMAKRFDEANSKYLEQLTMLEAEHKALEEQIGELSKTGAMIAQLDEQNKLLEEDKVKFKEYNAHLEGRIEKYQGRQNLLREEMERVERELQESEQEKSDLQAAVDKQGMTVQDIDRMNTERERLQKSAATTAQRLEESKKSVEDRELDAGQRLDGLERTVQEYNSLGYQIGIIPATTAKAKGQNYELSITVNSAPNFRSSRTKPLDSLEPERLLADANTGYQPQHLLNLDMKGDVKTGIVSLRKEVSERKNAAAEIEINDRDLLEKTREALEDREQEVEGLEHRVHAAEEECDKTREITNAQKMASDTQIEKLEKELAKMRTTLGESVQLMEQREMNTNVEYEQLTLKAAALREELHTEIERMLNDVIKFKVHVQKSLEDYEQFVAEEVEKELEEGDEETVESVDEQ